jgi:hypothetical protein
MDFVFALLLTVLMIWYATRLTENDLPGTEGARHVGVGFASYRVHPGDDERGAARRLGRLVKEAALLLSHLEQRYLSAGSDRLDQDARVAATRRLAARFDPGALIENRPGVDGTAFTLDKGLLIAMCLRSPANGELISRSSDEVLTFVFLHEMAHVAAAQIGHGKEFWSTFKWILLEAIECGVYKAVNYSAKPTTYCGALVNHSPLFDNRIVAL